MSSFWKLSAAGFTATAISYGPARMGFGLFVPEFRSAFSLSTQAAGLISSLGFFGFFAGLLISQAVTAHRGPRPAIIIGLIAATLGTATAAASSNLPVVCLGVVLAMSSAGFSWTPFNNVMHRKVEDRSRPLALSLVSTGTGLGVAFAGLAALIMSLADFSWRFCWLVFAGASAVALLFNITALRDVSGTPGPGRPQQWRVMLQSAALPLLAMGFCYGVSSAVYISFATDLIVEAGGVSGIPASATGSLVFISYGVCGLLGLLTAKIKAATGLPWLLRLLMLACGLSFVLAAVWPTQFAAVALSAGLQGLFVMMMSAVLSFWSVRLFPSLPSQSFTAVLLAAALGCVVGPAIAGYAADMFTAGAMFLGTALFAVAAGILIRSDQIRERPETPSGEIQWQH